MICARSNPARWRSQRRSINTIETHTQLVPREFVQNHGVHLSLCTQAVLWSGLQSDFFSSRRAQMTGMLFLSRSRSRPRASSRTAARSPSRLCTCAAADQQLARMAHLDGNMPGREPISRCGCRSRCSASHVPCSSCVRPSPVPGQRLRRIRAEERKTSRSSRSTALQKDCRAKTFVARRAPREFRLAG